MKITGLFKFRAIAPSATNLVLVTDGDFQYEMTEQEYVRGCYQPPSDALPWKS